MTDRDAEERRRIRVTDKRRVRANDVPAESDSTGSPSAPPSSTEGASSGDASAGSDEETRGSSEGTPSVTEEGPSVSQVEAGVGDRAEEYLADLRRLKAEFENYRKRVLREQTRTLELAAEPLVAKLLEVVDEFELALMAAEAKPDFDRFLHGVELVYAKLTDILRSEGLERIEAEDRPFDPERHEALLQAEGETDGEPYVADVLRTGYTLKGRVIRPAGVKVGRR
ncbi:MAG TPA: nucleotide exchange factor GrpE [Actinomycetota bacterium]|nr:nucleotide exchange factor GrpE [Actinomycetota bacterium]